MPTLRILCSTAALCAVPVMTQPVMAQPILDTQITLEGTTDQRERGLSWSDGRPTALIGAFVPASDAIAFDLEAMALRDSARHGGAEAALRLGTRYTLATLGGWTIAAGARGNVFVGQSGLSYGELSGGVQYTLGPARVIAAIDYAPPQKALGGSNLHIEAQALVGVPGLPLSLYGGVGHTSGTTREGSRGLRAARLRPGGDYTDYHLGIEHNFAGLAAGLRYSDTSIDSADVDRLSPYHDRHTGSRLAAYIRFAP